MFTFKFNLEKQTDYYNLVKDKFKTQFYQNLHFYVLPTMPEKFRSRVVYFPEKCEPEKIYRRHKMEIDNLEMEWNKSKSLFIEKIRIFFPFIETVDINISPSLYGSMGFVKIEKNIIVVSPRYDRKIIGLQKLVIRGLVNYKNKTMAWNKRQEISAEIQSTLYPDKKSLTKILDTQFAGKLAEESAKYLEKLKVSSKKLVNKPDNLTKSENIVFNLLLRNKNKLVSFDEIADWLWEDKSEEKFSEYAITKLTERLKRKLPKNIIHSQRGLGYILYI